LYALPDWAKQYRVNSAMSGEMSAPFAACTDDKF